MPRCSRAGRPIHRHTETVVAACGAGAVQVDAEIDGAGPIADPADELVVDRGVRVGQRAAGRVLEVEIDVTARVAEASIEMKAPMFVEVGAGGSDAEARRVEISKL